MRFYVPPISDDAKAFASVIERQGGLCLLKDEDTYWPNSDKIFFYGSIEGMKHVQKWPRQVGPNDVGGRDYNFVNWCDWNKLTCTTYYAKWGDLLMTRHYGLYPLAELRRFEHRVWRNYCDLDGRCYVRPNDNEKSFTGGLFLKGHLGPWLLQGDADVLKDDLLVLVGRPTQLRAEYRLWMANGKVITASQYIRNDKIEYQRRCPHGAIDIAEQAAKIWSPHPVFVIDVGETNGGLCRIIECGSVHTSGLYACDPEKVIQAIVDCQKES